MLSNVHENALKKNSKHFFFRIHYLQIAYTKEEKKKLKTHTSTLERTYYS